jgi:hypothetical protein
LQLLFAQSQHLPVVKPEGHDADEQKRAHYDPKDAEAARRQLIEGIDGHGDSSL